MSTDRHRFVRDDDEVTELKVRYTWFGNLGVGLAAMLSAGGLWMWLGEGDNPLLILPFILVFLAVGGVVRNSSTTVTFDHARRRTTVVSRLPFGVVDRREAGYAELRLTNRGHLLRIAGPFAYCVEVRLPDVQQLTKLTDHVHGIRGK